MISDETLIREIDTLLSKIIFLTYAMNKKFHLIFRLFISDNSVKVYLPRGTLDGELVGSPCLS